VNGMIGKLAHATKPVGVEHEPILEVRKQKRQMEAVVKEKQQSKSPATRKPVVNF